MTKRLVLAFLTFGLVLGGYFWATRTPEPSYNGRSVSEWLDAYIVSGAAPQPTKELIEAVEAIGRPAAPFLAKVLLRAPSRLDTAYAWRYYRLAPALQRLVPIPRSEKPERLGAAMALCHLRSNAVDVLPLLVNPPDELALANAINILALCAPHTRFEAKAVETLAHWTESVQLTYRAGCYIALGAFPNQTNISLPVLVRGLYRTLAERAAAAESLTWIGRPAIPVLMDAAKQEEGVIRPALSVLEKIDPEAAAQVRAERLVLEQKKRSAP